MSIEIGSNGYRLNTGSASTGSVKSAKAMSEEELEALEAEGTEQSAQSESEAAVYNSNSAKSTHALDSDTIKAMKDELEQRTQNLVQQMLGKQLDTLSVSDDSIWQKFRKGEFTATPEQIAQAQKDVADDGYWGVEQTSDRIVKYATALSGGDPEKLDTLISAFEKGYEAAGKAWGGQLPSLAQRTREAVLSKFEDLRKEYSASSAADGDAGE